MILSRLAFLGLVLLAGAGCYWVIDQTFATPMASGQSELVRLRSELGELRQRLQSARQELAALEQHGPGRVSAAITGMDGPAALAWLQGAVRDRVAAAQGTALSFQATSSPIGDSHAKLSLLLRARFSEAGLLSFVKEVEAADPPFIFELLDVQQLGLGNDGLPLDVTATIIAFHANAAAS